MDEAHTVGVIPQIVFGEVRDVTANNGIQEEAQCDTTRPQLICAA